MNCLLPACRPAQILLEHLFDEVVHAGNKQDGEYRDDDYGKRKTKSMLPPPRCWISGVSIR